MTCLCTANCFCGLVVEPEAALCHPFQLFRHPTDPVGKERHVVGDARQCRQRITGITPKLEQRLNDAGVFHYWQIADLDPEQTGALDRKLKLKGQIETEKWAEQAKKLVESAAV